MAIRKQGNIFILREPVQGESIVFSATDPAEFGARYRALVDEGCATIHQMLEKVTKHNPKAVAIRQMQEDGGCREITFGQMIDYSKSLAKALLEGGFCPESEVEGRKMRFLGVYLYNRPEFALSDLSGYYIGAMAVSLFEEPFAQMTYLVNKVEFDTIVTQPSYAKQLIKLIKDKTVRHIRNFIMSEELDEETKAAAKDLGISIFSLSALVEKGRTLKTPLPTVDPESVCVIQTTSGSTGFPKGVLLTHRTYICMCLGTIPIGAAPGENFPISMSYAFSGCKSIGLYCLLRGATITFYPPCPLINYMNLEKNLKLLKEAKPTVALLIPPFVQKLYDVIIEMIAKMPPAEGEEVKKAIETKIRLMKENKEGSFPELDKLLLPLGKKLFDPPLKEGDAAGGKCNETAMWYLRAVLGCPIRNLYGQTEIGGFVAAGGPFDEGGSVGVPQPGILLKLVDAEEFGFTTKDVVNGKPAPRGELYVKTPTSFAGYFKDPEKTKEIFATDGWMKARDLVQLDPENMSMKLIGRANDATKIGNGKYVAVEVLEKIYENNPYVSQMYIHAAPDKDCLVAIIFPREDKVMEWAKEKGITDDFVGLCTKRDLLRTVLDDLRLLAATKQLQPYEYITNAYLSHEGFSAKAGMLSHCGKLRRAGVYAWFKDKINDLTVQIFLAQKVNSVSQLEVLLLLLL